MESLAKFLNKYLDEFAEEILAKFRKNGENPELMNSKIVSHVSEISTGTYKRIDTEIF